MLKQIVAAALALMLAGPPALAETFVFAKAGGRGADEARDRADCAKRIVDANVFYQESVTADQAFQVGGLVGIGILAAIQPGLTKEARARSLQVCMRHLGWAYVPLQNDEVAGFRAAGADEARERWMDDFLARSDIAARSEAALAPRYLPLPAAHDLGAPWTVGASRIDPNSLSLASGPVAKGGSVLDGKLRRRAVAILTEDFKGHSGILSMHAPAGTEFQEYYWPPPWDPGLSEDKTAWCATFQGGFRLICFRSRIDGYSMSMVRSGEPWLVGWVDPEPFSSEAAYHFSLKLAEPTADSGAPIDFHLSFGGVTKDSVKLIATATRSGKQVVIWEWSLPIGTDGKASLPCWDRTLVLARAGESVTATFEPRDDGKGWVELQPPAAKRASTEVK